MPTTKNQERALKFAAEVIAKGFRSLFTEESAEDQISQLGQTLCEAAMAADVDGDRDLVDQLNSLIFSLEEQTE